MDANSIKIDEDRNAALEEIERLMDARPETPEGDRPYEKLQRALRAEVDEAAWAALYSAESRPFDRPDPGEPSVRWRSRRPASGATGWRRNR